MSDGTKIVSLDYHSFLKGMFSGMVGVTLSHPFDTIKSNLQTQRKIQYNLRSLYRGIGSPFFGVGFEKAIVFGTFTNVHNAIKRYDSSNSSPLLNTMVSGGISGFCASFIVTPIEKIKLMYQTSSDTKILMTKMPRLGLRDLVTSKSLITTLGREVPGFSIYFTTYDQIEQRIYNGSYTLWGSFVAGGLSGGFSWCFIYPQDLVKTKIQTSTEPNKISITGTVMEIYKQNGLRGFFRGFHFALMRAVPLHAGTFATMEFLKKY